MPASWSSRAGSPDVTITLAGCGRAPITVVDHLGVDGLAPYESRLHFAARAGGESANQDIDNVSVQFLEAAQTVPDYTSTVPLRRGERLRRRLRGPTTRRPCTRAQPTSAPQVAAGGPTGVGNMLRVGLRPRAGRRSRGEHGQPQQHHVRSRRRRRDRPGRGRLQLSASGPASGRGDGLGFALLNTATYGTSGPVAPLGGGRGAELRGVGTADGRSTKLGSSAAASGATGPEVP